MFLLGVRQHVSYIIFFNTYSKNSLSINYNKIKPVSRFFFALVHSVGTEHLITKTQPELYKTCYQNSLKTVRW